MCVQPKSTSKKKNNENLLSHKNAVKWIFFGENSYLMINSNTIIDDCNVTPTINSTSNRLVTNLLPQININKSKKRKTLHKQG